MSGQLYFRQLESGSDFATDDALARQMVNFTYAVGDLETGEALLIDPAYRPNELVDQVEADGLRVVGAVATHYHADHVGGRLSGQFEIAGIVELLERIDVPVHVHELEARWITERTGVGAGSLVSHVSGDEVRVGDLSATLIHTPGHTRGSQCVLIEGRLLSGDTLFLEGCGRTDLPGSDPDEMYLTLTQRLSGLDDEVVLYPGHHYSSERSASLATVRSTNFVLAPTSADQWLAMFS